MKTICLLTSLLMSTTLFAKSIGESKDATAASLYCSSKLKTSAFYKTIRHSRLGEKYVYESIEHNRFAKIDEDLNQKLSEVCAEGASMEELTRTYEMRCERACNWHKDTFKKEMFTKKFADKKDKNDFQDDCFDTCSSVKSQMAAFVDGLNSKSDNLDCNKDAISNTGRIIKSIDMNVQENSQSKGVKQK